MTAVPPTPAVSVRDTGIELVADPSRLITRFFVPGQEDVGPGDSRASPVIDRVMDLTEEQVIASMADVMDRFAPFHIDIDGIFELHASLMMPRIAEGTVLSATRRRLLGAAFTLEYAVEGAALCNPSMVVHPHQPDPGVTGFVCSVRGIGEGHRSSIGFRTGHVTADGEVHMDTAGRHPRTATVAGGQLHRSVTHRKLAEVDDDHENAAFALDPLQAVFDHDDLHRRITALADDSLTRRSTHSTIAHLESIANSSYCAGFAGDIRLDERVLWPHSAAEHRGMEDARFVRFEDDDGTVTYHGTYTAFDGINVAQHVLSTSDFTSFAASPMAGAAAMGKGLALFPRRVNGRFVALSRCDRETNSVAFSDDLRCWDSSDTIQSPERSWEILQLGNCGSPIETGSGWLVLTHGVGAMRSYALGAILLDLEDPRQLVATSVEPVLHPRRGASRRGYVPNVVYSCGAMAVGDMLVLPYGVGDQSIAVATLSIDELIGSMRRV
jgi:predicted GH43/DUF377 family glycosyl hydrolase